MAEGKTATESRGRVAILGDDVWLDLQLQERAAALAERGWEVTVVGRRTYGVTETEMQVGAAEIKVFGVRMPMRTRRFLYRRAPLRSPLSYTTGKYGQMKLQLANGRIADLGFRRALMVVERPPLASVRRTRLGVMMAVAKVHQRWVKLRIDRTRALRSRRVNLTAPIDRLSTWWWQRTMRERAWRKLDPGLWDRELALGKHIDELGPDLIHAYGIENLHLGARAKLRAGANGRVVQLIWDTRDPLSGTEPAKKHARWPLAQHALAGEFATYADRIVTTSASSVAQLVTLHGSSHSPVVLDEGLAPEQEADAIDRVYAEALSVGAKA